MRAMESQILMVVVLAPGNAIAGGGNGKGAIRKNPALVINHIDTHRILPLKDHVDVRKHIASFESISYELVERALETLKQRIVGKDNVDDFLKSVAPILGEEKFARLVELLKLGVNKDDAMQFLGYLESIVTHPRFPYHRRDITIEFLEKQEFARFLDDQVAGHFARSEPHLAQAFVEILGKEIGKELLEIVGKASNEKNNEEAQLGFHTLYVLNLLVMDYGVRCQKVRRMKEAALEKSDLGREAALKKGNGHAGTSEAPADGI